MKTERPSGVKTQVNALASSIILVCRKREMDAGTISRKLFIRELDEMLPLAIDEMIYGSEDKSPIAVVDLSQSAIGPGMEVFSKYDAVLEADGSPMTVRTALTLINKSIDEYFTKAESNMDQETRFCVNWFQQYTFSAGPFGEADVLARAKGTGVDKLKRSGVLEADKGKVRLYKASEYPKNWDPQKDDLTPAWEALHQMIRALEEGETKAGLLLAKMREQTEPIRSLAYRLYTVCERAKKTQEAGMYNKLIASWPAIVKHSQSIAAKPKQAEFDL